MPLDETIDLGKAPEIIKELSEKLADADFLPGVCHSRLQGEALPSHSAMEKIVGICRTLLFPGFYGDNGVTRSTLGFHVGIYADQLLRLLIEQITAAIIFDLECADNIPTEEISRKAEEKSLLFLKSLPTLRSLAWSDVMATYNGDPAALSPGEVIFSYPGIRATCNHRIAHLLFQLEVPILPRMISELAHSETGIDIHPGATIGEAFMIDHGTGVVIGATAIIGKNVKIYQGVTLGAKSFIRDSANNPVKGHLRHPIIGDNVVIYANTTVLGRINIGHDAVIGGNLWITEDVPPGERLVQTPPDNILRISSSNQNRQKQ
ncbi:MAG: serine acetyltransferase [Paramuribaculum sp.]|nr:serine acetyltransferase [Paramuribaculum sp.]